MKSNNRNESLFEKSLSLQPPLLMASSDFWQSRISKATLQIFSKKSEKHRFVFIGTGSSHHVALWAHWLFRSHGLDSLSLSSWDALNGAACLKSSSDILIMISHRGDRSLTNALGTWARSFQKVLLTGEGSPVGKHPSIVCSPQEHSKAHSMSLMGAICAISELLAVAKPKIAKSIREDRIETGYLLEGLRDQGLFSDLPTLNPKAGLYFVGGGPFEATAREAALKAKEMAHIAAHSSAIEEFLHGPMAAVNRLDHVHIFSPSIKNNSKTNSIDAILQKQRPASCEKALKSLKVQVFKPSFPLEIAVPWQAVLALGYAQRLCLQYALQRKTDPDSNRHEDKAYAKAFKLSEF